MISARSYFARMNENRGESDWLTHESLLKGTEQFLKLNSYSSIEYSRVFDLGGRAFSSPIVASRIINHDETGKDIGETIVCILKPEIKNYDLSFLGHMESVTFNILDNYESTNPMLVTDSLSYFYILRNQEISVAIEDMMRDGLLILFLNHRFAYAFFDKFEDMTKPVSISR